MKNKKPTEEKARRKHMKTPKIKKIKDQYKVLNRKIIKWILKQKQKQKLNKKSLQKPNNKNIKDGNKI